MRRQDAHDPLRARLHGAAEAHEPDRARILARIERGMAVPGGPGRRVAREPVAGWFRVVGTTAAVAGVLALCGYAVASAVKDDGTPAGRPAAVSPAPEKTPAAGRTPTPDGTQDGPLRSEGSVDPHGDDFWAQSDVTLRTSRPLTALTVRLKVARTGGVSSTGAWLSLPKADFSRTVEEKGGFLVYTWVLKQGREVPAGEWVFAGQYDHVRGGRDAEDDGYTLAGTAGGTPYVVTGGFTAHDTSKSSS